MLFGVNQRLRVEDVDSPLIQIRAVKTVLLVCVTGDRGLCGGYNALAIRKVSGNIRQCVLFVGVQVGRSMDLVYTL